MPFEAILFDPVTKDSARVSVRLFGSSLEVTGGRETLRVDPSKCELGAGGWDKESVQISWRGEGGAFALSSTDPQARLELIRIPAFEAAIAKATSARARTRRGGRVGMIVVALATLLPALMLIALFAFRNQIVDIVLKRIPLSVDQQVGRMFEGQFVGSKDALPDDNEAARAIRSMVERLEAGSGATTQDFKVSVQRNKDVNAFAAPGGLIVVYTGLIEEAGSAEEVAGVLAHEMAHVTNRHSMRQLIYGVGVLPLTGLLIGQPDAAALFQDVGRLSELKFSRSQEEDADRTGFDSLVAAGISTDGLPRFFDRLAKREGVAPSFISTHPSSAERALAIRQRTKALPGSSRPTPLEIDWTAVKAAAR